MVVKKYAVRNYFGDGLKAVLLLAAVLLGVVGCYSVPSPPDEKKLPDETETPRMMEWSKLRYGIFLHFGMSTFTGAEIDSGAQPSNTYAPKHPDVDQWIRVARDAGMKYAVLTSKHVSGHCLWDSKVLFHGKKFDYDVATSGNTTDIVRAFVDACCKYGITPGLYYCLLDYHNNSVEHKMQWKNQLLPDDFFQLAKDQLAELARNYPTVRYYWIDIPRAASEGQRADLYDLLRRENPGCVVLFNCGILKNEDHEKFTIEGTKGASWPTDILNSERCPISQPFESVQTWQGRHYHLAYEHCDVIGRNWFWTADDSARPTDELFRIYNDAVNKAGGSLLLDVGPDRDGRIENWQIEALMKLKARIDASACKTEKN